MTTLRQIIEDSMVDMVELYEDDDWANRTTERVRAAVLEAIENGERDDLVWADDDWASGYRAGFDDARKAVEHA